MRVFDYVILYHPTPEQIKEDKAKSKIIADGRVLAKDQASAQLKVTLEIPSEYQENTDQLEIAIRAF